MDSNSDCRCRRRARWPLDHHHGPSPNLGQVKMYLINELLKAFVPSIEKVGRINIFKASVQKVTFLKKILWDWSIYYLVTYRVTRWGDFSNFLGTKFFAKIAQIFSNILRLLWKMAFYVKLMWILFGQLMEKIGLLFTPTSGHTGYLGGRLSGKVPTYNHQSANFSAISFNLDSHVSFSAKISAIICLFLIFTLRRVRRIPGNRDACKSIGADWLRQLTWLLLLLGRTKFYREKEVWNLNKGQVEL